jgi:hypothetical protein
MRTKESRLFGGLAAHHDELEQQKDAPVVRIHIEVGIVLPVERAWS